MAYQLSEKEIVHHHYETGVSRILREQTDEAEANLSRYNGQNLYETIQSSRACVSRIRALLRLIKPFIGNQYSAENRRFRELGMELARLREKHAVVQALEKLKYLSGNINSILQLDNLKERYLLNNDTNPEEIRQRRKTIGQALNSLRKAQNSFEAIQPQIHDEEALAECLQRSSQEVTRTYNNALQFGGDDDFHHWRKAINTLLFQTEVLQNFKFAPPQKKRNFLQRLSTQLDFYSDLTSLAYTLDEWRENQITNEDYEELIAITENQKRVMSINLLHLGEKFFKMSFTPTKENCLETYH